MLLDNAKCPNCGSTAAAAETIPLSIGKDTAVCSLSFRCGSIALVMGDGTKKVVRSVPCTEVRMNQLRREIRVMEDSFWCEDPAEPKLIGIIRTAYEAAKAEPAAPAAQEEASPEPADAE